MADKLRRYPHSGKFEGGLVIDEYMYELGADEEVGEADTTGWYGLLRGPFSVSDIMKSEDPKLNSSERAFLAKQAGAIVYEDSQGFVEVDYFEDSAELEMKWDDISEEILEMEQEAEIED